MEMANKLSNDDYVAILKYYDVPLEKKISNTKIKTMAEDILATKLCKCIKKVQKKQRNLKEPRAIALCKTSVLHRKGIESGRFTCKKKATFIPNKGSREKLTRRNNKSPKNKTRKNY
jgi:hypothetical protein